MVSVVDECQRVYVLYAYLKTCTVCKVLYCMSDDPVIVAFVWRVSELSLLHHPLK